jgi:hypothetical protein
MNLAAFGRLGLYWFVVLLTAGTRFRDRSCV